MINIVCLVTDDGSCSIHKDDIVINLNDTKYCHYDYLNKHNISKYRKYSNSISDEALDLLNISLFIYFADKLIERSTSFDAWTRNISISIPVISFEKFQRVRKKIEALLRFLSGDYWSVEFRKRDILEKEEKAKAIIGDGNTVNFDCISMLSGGLDSYVGAIDLLSKGMKPLFVSHYGGGNDVSPFQKKVKELLKDKYTINDDNFISFHAKALEPREQTTRTRSFMFFSHAIAVSTMLDNVNRIIVPENGLISLNIPLTNSRLGSSSTRTTHPYYMNLFNDILGELEFRVQLENPYQFKTKGEMIKESKEKEFLYDTLHYTMSCSHPSHARWTQSDMKSHCGYCVPCIIRRAAIMKSGCKDNSVYRESDLKLSDQMTPTVFANLNSFKFALQKFQMKKTYDFDIQLAGPIDRYQAEYVSVYQRGMKEIAELFYAHNEE